MVSFAQRFEFWLAGVRPAKGVDEQLLQIRIEIAEKTRFIETPRIAVRIESGVAFDPVFWVISEKSLDFVEFRRVFP
jgi:hypothetical protein